MGLSFIFPDSLWLLLLLPLIGALGAAAPRRLSRRRAALSLVVRLLGATALILALAGAQLILPSATTTTVFLLDASDSVALSQRARAETFVQQALAAMPPDDQAAVVVFGRQALVERTASGDRLFGQVTTLPDGGLTNIQSAVQLGLALLPAEGRQRIVLLSDGGENNGSALAAARLAAARGIPIDVVQLSSAADGPDAQIGSVALPGAAREGQQLRMQIETISNRSGPARLLVRGPGDTLLVDQQLQLEAGTQRFEVLLPEASPGFFRYVVRLELPDDVRNQNNVAEAFTYVSGAPRVLLVEGSPGEAAALAAALAAANIPADRVAPDGVPGSLGDLSRYDAVVLCNVPKRALPDRTISVLDAFVNDAGRGLLMVGGPDSFGAGGWRGTPVERALPVLMDIPARFRIPPASIVVLIDISGSMGQEEGGRTKLSLALEGAQRIAALMRDEDEITVFPFDSTAQQVVGPLPGSRRDEAIEAMSRVTVGGGGINIHDGLLEAETYILASKNPIRHIITLTDGSDTQQQEGALEIVRRLHDQRVTLTSIAIGNGEHVRFIGDMANVGGGRTFLTDQASNIPSIMTNEAQVVMQPYVIEAPFTPVRGLNHPILRGFETTPPLNGYVITTPRDTAQVLLSTPDGLPILVIWQHGLGRAAAWTSDLSGRWGESWISAAQFSQLGAQLVNWLLPLPENQNLALQTRVENGALILEARATTPVGAAQTGLRVTAQLAASNGERREVTLLEVGAGRYRGAVAAAQPGAYLVLVAARTDDGTPAGLLTGGAVVPLSAEFVRQSENPVLLQEIVLETGGRLDPPAARVFDAPARANGTVQEIGLPLLWFALLLLPLDIALRRLLLRPAQARQLVREVRVPPPEPVRDALSSGEAQETAPRPPNPREAQLARLREAQERARKRARGEE